MNRFVLASKNLRLMEEEAHHLRLQAPVTLNEAVELRSRANLLSGYVMAVLEASEDIVSKFRREEKC